jgi:multidrug resistance efflux pump
LLWIVPLVVALGAGGWWAFRRTEGPRVDAITPVRQPMVQTIVTSGRVVQRRQSKLGAMIPGTVAEVGVEDGDRVEAEALLVRLADEDALANLAEAEASVSEAEARLARVQGVGRRMAEQALRQATIEARQAEVEFQRQQALAGSGAVSELTFERARRDRDQARSRRISASLEVAAFRGRRLDSPRRRLRSSKRGFAHRSPASCSKGMSNLVRSSSPERRS